MWAAEVGSGDNWSMVNVCNGDNWYAVTIIDISDRLVFEASLDPTKFLAVEMQLNL